MDRLRGHHGLKGRNRWQVQGPASDGLKPEFPKRVMLERRLLHVNADEHGDSLAVDLAGCVFAYGADVR